VNLSIWCFNVVQPETRFHFQSANQIAKQKVKIFKKFQNFKNLQKIQKRITDFSTTGSAGLKHRNNGRRNFSNFSTVHSTK
jgi:hypothetical protein